RESMGICLRLFFMLVNGIMIPITAFLIEKYTTRRLFDSDGFIYIRYFYQCSCTRLFDIIAWTYFPGVRCGDYDATYANDIILTFPERKTRNSDGLVRTCHCICSGSWTEFIRMAC